VVCAPSAPCPGRTEALLESTALKAEIQRRERLLDGDVATVVVHVD
jgi:hypothetical protein